MRQPQMRVRRPAQTLAPNQICTSTAELSRENSQRSGNADRSTADASGPEPHDSGHTVNDRVVAGITGVAEPSLLVHAAQVQAALPADVPTTGDLRYTK